MAVLRSKRQLAKTEYENAYTVLYNEVRRYMIAIPRRRQKWLCTEINKLINLAFRDIVEINDYYDVEKEKRNEEVRKEEYEVLLRQDKLAAMTGKRIYQEMKLVELS